MEVQFKKKFPKGALSFYIELYIKRKCTTEKKCSQQEAMKSWISLNKSEKQFFETKYQEFRSNFNKSIGMRLKNAEPYMKLKEVIPTNKNSSQNVSDNNEEINKETNQNELVFSKIEVDDNEDSMPSTQNEENAELDLHDYYLEVSGSPIPTTQDEVVSIPEPIPPKIMRGKDLFVIIKEREQNDLVWEELTKPQKGRYINAALEIKKNYLKQYREYLDHLSPEKLFNHYRNIVNSVGIYD